MLGGHSHCLTVPESQFVVELWRASQRRNGAAAHIDKAYLLSKLLNHWRFKLWGLPLDPQKNVADIPGNTYKAFIEWVVQSYGAQVGKAEATIWVDHTPTNLKYATWLLELFPTAKFIHMVRDGRAIASSIKPLDWGPNTIIRACHWWIQKISYGLAAESFWGTDKIMRVRYEDVVSDSEKVMKQVSEFVGIDYQPAMTRGDGYVVPSYTNAQHALVGQAPDKSRLNDWENKLAPREVEIFEAISGDLLHKLGYDMKYGLQARPFNTPEWLKLEVEEYWKWQVANRFRRWRRINEHLGDGSV
jgi:hypothetical protein